MWAQHPDHKKAPGKAHERDAGEPEAAIASRNGGATRGAFAAAPPPLRLHLPDTGDSVSPEAMRPVPPSVSPIGVQAPSLREDHQQAADPIQRTLAIDGTEIDRGRIERKGAFKTRLNSIISQEANARGLQPNKVRGKLAEMADSDEQLDFDSLRTAVVAAIGLITNEVSDEELETVQEAETELHDELDAVIDEYSIFRGFPKNQIWRLLMDGKHQAIRGKYGFENERGYMAGMMRGFTMMLRTLGEDLTTDLYEQLHDTCLEDVQNRNGEDMELGYRDNAQHGEGFPVDRDTWSLAGYDELVSKYRSYNDENDPRYGAHPVGEVLAQNPRWMAGPEVNPKIVKLRPLLRARCQEFAGKVLDMYHQEIAVAEGNDAKLEAIVRCCQDLDQLHLFVDGNIRTIAFLVLNKLLLENGLSPAILDEPNIFDCKSVAELKAAVQQGQKRFGAMRKDV